jgi:nucleotide sugar dehydrogenase
METSTIFVNIIGYGYVGSAVGHLCKSNKVAFCTCDKALRKEPEALGNFSEIEELVKNSEQYNKKNVYFIAVPTPSSDNGECDVSIVESVISEIAVNHTKETTVLIKSTLKPGTCRTLVEKYSTKTLTITYCPEFLREKTFKEDMYNANFVLLGNDDNKTTDNTIAVRVMKVLYGHNKDIDIICKSYEECEIFKYTINVFLAVKVWYFNEINVICEKFGVEYKNLESLFYLDPRIGESHTAVPGHDQKYGFGGKCLPKETRGMRYLQQTLGIENRVLEEILKRNGYFRKE